MKTATKRDITVLMPVHNEREIIRQVIGNLIEVIGERILELIIIVTPTSSSATMSIIKQLAGEYDFVRVETQKIMPGIGNAYRQGYAIVRGKYVLNMDADGEMDADTVPAMVDLMDEGYDLVQASRWAKGGGFIGYNRIKYVLNWGYQKLFRVLFNTHISDLTYGFKIMRREVAQGFRWNGILHEFACENVLRPIKSGAKIGEVPTVWRVRTEGEGTTALWRNFRYAAMAINIWIQGAKKKGE